MDFWQKLALLAVSFLAVACQHENSITINVKEVPDPFAGTDFASPRVQFSKADPPYELESEVVVKTESNRHPHLYGIFKNNSTKTYKTVYLIVYMYDWQNA